MKQFFKSALLAMAIAGTATASAENLSYNFDPNTNEYGLRGWVEYQESGNAYPNFWVQLPNFNSTTPEAAADGERVFENGTIKFDVTGPEGFTFSQQMNTTPGFPAAESHAWCHMGIIETPGTYDFTIVLTLNYVDAAKEPIVENFSGNFVIPTQEVDPSVPTIDYNIVSNTEGVDFIYKIDLGTNSADDVESVLVALLRGGEAFNADALYSSTALEATISVHFDGNDLGIWFKAQVTMKDGKVYQLKPWDQAMTLKKEVTTSLTYNLTVGEFTRTGETSGTLPYKISCEGDLNLVDHWIVWASRVGNENMNVTDVWDLEGELNLTVLPANQETQIWPKVQPVWKLGGRGDVVQTSCMVDTRSAETPVYTLTADNTEALSSTTGTVDYKITVTNGAENIEKFVIYVVRAGEGGDVEVGRIETTETTGTIDLSNLLENAVTDIWVKAYAIDKSGNELATVQFPGAAQGWTGLSINTTATELNAINVIGLSEETVYFNLQGLKIAEPERGKIYIVVRNGKASKAIFK